MTGAGGKEVSGLENLKISLKAARVNRGMTQNEAAKAVKINRETLIRWENGKSCPDGRKLIELCQLYGISLDNIFLPPKST